MNSVRYTLALLVALAPVLALAQGPDSVHVVVDGVEYPAYVSAITRTVHEEIGPLPIVAAEPFIACVEDPDHPGWFLPQIDNPEEIAGNIAFVLRGSCSFVMKLEAATEAGATAVVVMNNDETNPDAILVMGGVWPLPPPPPAVMISYNSGQAILGALGAGPTEATLVPIRVASPPPSAAFLDTGVVETALFDNGFVGTSPGYLGGPGFAFNGENGLYVGSVLVGHDGAVVQNPYGRPEFETVDRASGITAPFPSPFEGFDEGYRTTYASAEFGVLVTASAYARAGDAFVVLDFAVANPSGGALSGVYVGLFADLDVGDAATNLGGYVEAQRLVYVYAASEEISANYFGIVALTGDVSGWTLVTDAAASDSALFAALTTVGEGLTEPQDARAVIGVGPFNLADAPATARFALVAGASEAEIIANAQAARDALAVAAEEVALAGASALSVWPNPSRGPATVGLALAEAAEVRVSVYDVLGREVAVLHVGALTPGAHTFRFDGQSLAPGLYVLRATGGEVTLARRLTVLR